MMRLSSALRLTGEERGAAAVEFALTLPVLFALIFGAIDLGYQAYLRALLDTAMIKAARKMTLPSAASADVRDAINAEVSQLMKTALSTTESDFTLSSYDRYARVNAPSESFVDANGDGRCSPGEIYQDVNGNGHFDTDASIMGWGTADDVVAYTATVTYPRLLPLSGLLGLSDVVTLQNTKLLRIQPFTLGRISVTRAC